MSLPRNVLDTFRKLRRAGYGAKFAADYARTLDRFQDAESEGRARIRFESDPDSSLQSNYDRSVYQSDSAGRKLWAEFERIEERDGWFGVVAEVRAEPADSPIRWQDGERDPAAEQVDSLWGLLGYGFGDTDPRGALPLEYRLDMMRACLDRLDAIDAEQRTAADDVATVRAFLARFNVKLETHDPVAAFERIVRRLES